MSTRSRDIEKGYARAYVQTYHTLDFYKTQLVSLPHTKFQRNPSSRARDMKREAQVRTFGRTRPFHNRGQNTKVKIETGSQWIMVTLKEVEVCPKFQTDRTSGTLSTGPVLSRHHALHSPRAPRVVVGAAYTSRLATAGRGSGNNTCKCFIESSFNACLKVMFPQDRDVPVT